MGIEYQPVRDWVYVQPDEPKTTRGGIIMPDVAEDGAPKRYFNGMGLVLAVGPGIPGGVQESMPVCKVGDRILFYPRPSNCHKPHDKEIIMIQNEQIVAVVKGEGQFN